MGEGLWADFGDNKCIITEEETDIRSGKGREGCLAPIGHAKVERLGRAFGDFAVRDGVKVQEQSERLRDLGGPFEDAGGWGNLLGKRFHAEMPGGVKR
jgi:hypothetical protein